MVQVENFSYNTSGESANAPSVADLIDSARMEFRAKYDRGQSQIAVTAPAANADSEFSVPHHLTFAAVWNWVQKYYYSYYDESQIDSLQNSLAMRRDGFIQELLWHRQMPVTGLTYTIEVDDPDDPGQAQFRKCLERVVNRLPYYKRMQIQLLESIFYGKSGVQLRWGRKKIAGRTYTVPVKHTPVQGDKISLGFADVPAIYVWPGSDLFKLPEYARYIRNIQLGPAFMLEEEAFRRNFVIHQFQPADADYLFEGEKAGGVQGQGVRDRFYWTWNLRQQVLMWYLNALERVGVNGMLYGKYPSGNPKQQGAVMQALANLISTNVAAFPYTMGNDVGDLIGQIPPSPVGYDVMYQLLTHLEEIMRRGVLGQDLSGRAKSTGLGSEVGVLAGEAKEDVVIYDAGCLAETIDEQLIQNIVKLNTWEYNGVWYYGDDLPFGCRYMLQTDRRNVGELIGSAEALWRMGVPLDMDDLRERTGLKAPRSAATALVQMGGMTGATPNRQAVESSIGSEDQPSTPDRFMSADEMDRIALLIDPAPTESQKKAGNYRKAHATLHGLPITLETGRGRVRSGFSPSGKPWSVTMPHHYGYIKRTESEADQDHIDVFIGRHPESQIAFVVDQLHPDSGRFDEHKCMLGFRNEHEAKCGYLDSYSPGWKGFGAITPVVMEHFKTWCYEGDTSRPFCDELHARLGGFTTGGPPFLLGHASRFGAADLPELFTENPCGDGGDTHGFHEGNTCQQGGRGGAGGGDAASKGKGGMTQEKGAGDHGRVTRTVGKDFPSEVYHGTISKSAKAFMENRDLPESERSRTLNEYGGNVIFASEKERPHQALMFGQGKSAGGARSLVALKLKDGAKVLDLSHEMTRRPMVGSPDSPVMKIAGRPAFTDDMGRWLNETRAARGLNPLSEERIKGAVDPTAENFDIKEYVGLLPGYAKSRGYSAFRLADETVIVDRSSIVGARKVDAKEKKELEAASENTRHERKNNHLYTDDVKPREHLSSFDWPELFSAAHTDPGDPGVMIALMVPPDAADALALPDGEPSDQLHVTLAYLGRLSEIGDESVEKLRATLPYLAEAWRPIGGAINGVGRFSASESSDGQDVIYGAVDCPDLTEFREVLCNMLSIGEIPYKRTHGYTPHVTLKYINTSDPMPIERLAPVPVSFGGLTLAVGNNMQTYEFGHPAIQGTPEYYSRDIADEIRSVVKRLPEMMPCYGNVYLNRDTGEVYIEAGDSDDGDKIRAWQDAVSAVEGVKKVDCECEYVPKNILESVESGGGWKKIAGA